jgi:hypothetical protein
MQQFQGRKAIKIPSQWCLVYLSVGAIEQPITLKYICSSAAVESASHKAAEKEANKHATNCENRLGVQNRARTASFILYKQMAGALYFIY